MPLQAEFSCGVTSLSDLRACRKVRTDRNIEAIRFPATNVVSYLHESYLRQTL
jgi:hypothetical protein